MIFITYQDICSTNLYNKMPLFWKKINLAINGFLLPFFSELNKPPKAKISFSCLCTTYNHH
jgi:hypothetical protein